MNKSGDELPLLQRRARVAVLGDTDFPQATALLQGITEFSDKQSKWDILPLHYTQEDVVNHLIRTKSIDGLIGSFVSDRWIATLVGDSRIAVVNTSSTSTISSVPSVIPDDREIGRLAAQHLLRRQFTTYAFGGLRSCAYSHEREKGFAEALEASGFRLSSLPTADISRHLYAWLEVLRGLPHPIAVFCANDYVARRLILDAAANGLPAPAAVSVIGVGDSALDSFFAGVGITSIALATHAIGYRAAQLLHGLLTDQDIPKQQRIMIPPAGLVARASTGMGPMHPLVARTLDLIAAQLDQPQLTVAGLVRQVHASRRLLEIRFRETLGHSPHAEITQQRMALARRLLLDPRIRIADIASRCGYTELSHFYHRFKAAHDSTPAAWRRETISR